MNHNKTDQQRQNAKDLIRVYEGLQKCLQEGQHLPVWRGHFLLAHVDCTTFVQEGDRLLEVLWNKSADVTIQIKPSTHARLQPTLCRRLSRLSMFSSCKVLIALMIFVLRHLEAAEPWKTRWLPETTSRAQRWTRWRGHPVGSRRMWRARLWTEQRIGVKKPGWRFIPLRPSRNTWVQLSPLCVLFVMCMAVANMAGRTKTCTNWFL